MRKVSEGSWGADTRAHLEMRYAPMFAKSTDFNQKEIVDELRQQGYSVEIIGRPVDILVASKKTRLATNFLFEIKRPGEKPRTPSQKEFLKNWPGQVRIIETAEEAIEVMKYSYLMPEK